MSVKQSITLRDTGITVIEVLQMIADGNSYRQILQTRPQLTPADIQASAQIALVILRDYVTSDHAIEVSHKIELTCTGKKLVNLSKVREEFPRAFMPWSDKEDQQLSELFRQGVRTSEIAKIHQRNFGGVQIRLKRLGLVRA